MAKERVGARPTAALPITSVELDLLDGESRVGWISGRRIGFLGFANRTEAVHAALAAHRALTRRLASEGRMAPVSATMPALAVAYDGDRATVLADGEPIALLASPGPDSPGGPASFGFEIRIPEPAYELDVRAAAYRMYIALRKSGIAWTFRTAIPVRAAQAPDVRSPDRPHTVVSANEATTTLTGGQHDDVDRSPHRPRDLPRPQWASRRRARTGARTDHEVRGLR